MRDGGGKSIRLRGPHMTHVNPAGTLGPGLGTKGTETPKATGAEPNLFNVATWGKWTIPRDPQLSKFTQDEKHRLGDHN